MKNKRTFKELLLKSDGANSVVVVLLGFVFATILVACVGRNPAGMYKAFLQSLTGLFQKKDGSWSWNIRYVGEWLAISVPYILTGLCMGFAARAGLFNIGGEGQYIIGMTVAQVIALNFAQIPGVHWIVAILCAIVAGAVWGGVVGFLKAKFEVSEVVTTIMLNYVALYLSRIITMSIPGTNTYKTLNFPETVKIKWSFLSSITNGSTLNIGIFFAIVAVILYWFLMEKTNLGFGLRATGFNKDAARYAGIPVVSSIVISMAISGAFAGLAGGTVALGSFNYGRVISSMDNYGFTGIAVALVGNNTALGTGLAGLLFGLLHASQTLMQSQKIPKEITFIIQGLIVIFIALREGIRIFILWRDKKKANKALSKAMVADSAEKAAKEADK
ncbi:MAG: ABC transporter permease [Treponemataceae bacterium]|jgi:simple sugar transport system permease protein|nr:ABC transporter permease [Treponemataceae bacterium]